MKKFFKSKLILQVLMAAFIATFAAIGIVSAASTIGANILTTGTLTVDVNTLYVDATNDKVGVGTTTPFATLSIDNNAGVSNFIIGSSTATYLERR